MRIVGEIDEIRAVSREARRGGKTIALVPTMGALHQGHLELVRKGKASGDMLIVSIFVNPAQFGPGEDLFRYPRDFEGDKAKLQAEGVDVLFCPSVEAVYPVGFKTSVEVEGLSERLCGVSRPGHFQGVATVVAKLFNMVSPHKAVFGLKDFQQLLIIKKMVEDLDMDLEIVEVETVREPDGLAVSSRNAYLKKDERRAAVCIPRALQAASEAFSGGERGREGILREVKKIMEAEELIVVDYLSLCDPETLEELEEATGRALLAVAAKVGSTRLIDNRMLS